MAKVHWKPNAKPAFPDMVTPFAFLIAVTKQLAVTDLILAIWRGLLSVGYHRTSRPLSTRQVSRAPPSTVWYCKHLDEVERPCQTLQLKFFINVIGTITFFFRARPFYWDWLFFFFMISSTPMIRRVFNVSWYSMVIFFCQSTLRAEVASEGYLWPFWLVFAVEPCSWH